MIKKSVLLGLFVGLMMMPLFASEEPSQADNSGTSATAAVSQSSEPADSDTPTTPQAVPPIPAEVLKIATVGAKFDKLNMICTTWNIGCPSTGDSLTQDMGGYRTALARHNIGVIGMSFTNVNYNFLHAPQNPQLFDGEKPTYLESQYYWVTFNVPSKKIQFVVGYAHQGSNWIAGDGPNTFHFDNLYLHQALGKLSYDIGYQTNDTNVYGGYIAGSLASGTMGEKAVIPYALGMSYSPYPAPSLHVKYTYKSGLYISGVLQRSIDPNGIEAGNQRDQQGLRLIPKGDKALYIAEIGYKKAPTPGVMSTWFRATGFYNSSPAQDYSSSAAVLAGKKGHNGAMSIAFDRQLMQSDKYLAYRGIYVNAIAQYAVPDMNVYHQYYQLALYSIGLMKSRPLDIIIFDVNRTQFSRTALNSFEAIPHTYGAQMGVPSYDDSTAVGVNYGYHVRPGATITPSVMYTRHPTFAPKLDSPLTAKVQLTLTF